MSPASSLRVFSAAAVASWAMIGVEAFLPLTTVATTTASPASRAAQALSVGAFLTFGLLLWRSTRRIRHGHDDRAGLALLGAQILLSLLVSTDLLLLVAVEAPLLLSSRAAMAWLGVQTAVAVGMGLAFSASEHFEALPGLGQLPHAVLIALTILSLALWQGLAFAGGLMAATQYRSAQELARVNAELEATQALLGESTRVAERLHIARELHDSVGHHLTALRLNLELARLHASGNAAEPVADAASVAGLLLAEVRVAVGTLRRDRTIDVRQALDALVAGVQDPLVHLALAPGLGAQEPAHAHAVFRCVQEALTNALRHAQARNIWIEVTRDRERLEVRVRDDGRGASESCPAHGLSGMRERFEGEGGGVEFDAQPGRGFGLRAWLPVAPGSA